MFNNFKNSIREVTYLDTIYYRVTGLKGLESKERLYNALKDINEITNVGIDYQKETVKVDYDGYVNPQKIEQCITQAGCTIRAK
jgi:copper chaperone CopZ